MRTTTRLDDLERLAARIELEIRAERARRPAQRRRRPGRPALREPDAHGAERDYQAHRHRGDPACDLCKAGHALYNRRRDQARRAAGVPRQRRGQLRLVPNNEEQPVDPQQMTIYDALREAR